MQGRRAFVTASISQGSSAQYIRVPAFTIFPRGCSPVMTNFVGAFNGLGPPDALCAAAARLAAPPREGLHLAGVARIASILVLKLPGALRQDTNGSITQDTQATRVKP